MAADDAQSEGVAYGSGGKMGGGGNTARTEKKKGRKMSEGERRRELSQYVPRVRQIREKKNDRWR